MSRLLAASFIGGRLDTPLPRQPTISVGAVQTVSDTSNYNAWPIATKLDNGDLILVYTLADSHHADNTGRAVVKVSTDQASTWGGSIAIYDHSSLWTSPYGVSQTSTGRIFVPLWRDNWNVSGTGEAGIIYSDDGSTWTDWIDLESSFSQEDYCAGPVIELPNGNLLVSIEGSSTGQAVSERSSHTLLSTDGGDTWGSEVTVIDYGVRPYYESKLVRLDNDELLCVHRTSNLTGTHYVSRSVNKGTSWLEPWAGPDGYGAPSTIQLANRTLVMVTRRNSDAAVIAYTSVDRGETWSDEAVLDDTMEEMEYACPVELDDGRVLVVYGSQPTSSQTNSDIKQVILTLT